mgnify:CR=1 FL=1
MVSFHILLGAEDQRDRLVDHIIVEKKNVLFLVSDSACRAFLKIDRSAEEFLRIFMKHAVGLDLADGFLSFVESDVVHIKDCIVSAGAKTGTAQLGGGLKNNGVFVAFAPYDDPEIAIALVLEKGDAGAALASTAVTILNSYFSRESTGSILSDNELIP